MQDHRTEIEAGHAMTGPAASCFRWIRIIVFVFSFYFGPLALAKFVKFVFENDFH